MRMYFLHYSNPNLTRGDRASRMEGPVAHDGKLFIGGAWVAPSSDEVIEVISPHTEAVIDTVAAPTPGDVDTAVAAARHAVDEGPWGRTDPAERVATIRRFAEAYGERRRDMAQVITAEMGAPISFSKMSHTTLPWSMISSFAALAEAFPWTETRTGFHGQDIRVRREPVGVVAAIVPWNMPQFLLIGKLVPALLAGNAVVVKPAPETPLDAYLLAEVLESVGLPEGLVSILPAGREVGEHLVNHPGVDKVSFTGSTDAGRKVAAACGANLKRVSLELGGKSAAIVLDDADPAAMAEGLKVAALMNSGQACVAQTRVLVPQARAGEMTDALVAMLEGLAVGDPAERETDVGPLVAQRQQDRVRGYIELGEKEGARLVTGGADLPDTVERGWYIRPTLFADVDNGMRIAQEEIFGPVITVIPYGSDDEAVRLANDSSYGLSGSVWTADVERGLDAATRVRSGTFGVNQPYTMDPAAPFGGMKASGIGRELGPEGLDEYVELKSISVAP